jgi:hypothetical protein
MRKIEKTGKRILKIAMSLLVGGVAIFFVSCEKEVLGEAQGHIRVDFTLGDAAYGAEEAVMRGAGRKIAEPETVAVPLEGGMHLYATLAEDEAVPLRASTMAENTRIRIVVFKDGTYLKNAEYKVNAAGGIVSVLAAGLTLTEYGTYNFVAYSLNKNTVPAYSTSATAYLAGNTNGNDPLWGETGNVVIDSDNVNLSIIMRHVFSRLKIVVSTANYPGTLPLISAVTARVEGFRASLKSGIFSKGAAENQAFTPTSFEPETSVTSDERDVYAGEEATTVIRITSITLDGTAWNGPIAQFNTKLEYSRSYTLTVTLGKVVWAGSNIYWKWEDPDDPDHEDGGYLTFDAPGAAFEDQIKQGIFFKWGSLVGISPGGGHNSAYSTSIPVYVPEFSAQGSTSWDTPAPGLTWASIPYVNDAVTGSFRNTYLADDARNTDNDYAYWRAKKGDICRYISENGYGPGGKYRMPSAYEQAAKEGNYAYGTGGWTKYPAGSLWNGGRTGFPSTTDGTYPVADAYISNSNGNISFPASGYRDKGSGVVQFPGYNVLSWSASCAISETANALALYGVNASDGVYVTSYRGAVRYNGLPVRCIQN